MNPIEPTRQCMAALKGTQKRCSRHGRKALLWGRPHKINGKQVYLCSQHMNHAYNAALSIEALRELGVKG